MSPRIVLRRSLALTLPLLLCLAFWLGNLGNVANKAWMDSMVRDQGLYGVAVYVGLVATLTSVGVPRQVLSFLGGYVFGALYGAAWATLGTALGCALTFSYARGIGRDWIKRRYGHNLAGFNAFLCRSPFLLTTAVRIVPLGSNFLTNMLAGVSAIPALPFLGGSCLGFWIQNFIFALLGSGLHISTPWQTGISIALYVVSLLLGWGLYRHYKRATLPQTEQ